MNTATTAPIPRQAPPDTRRQVIQQPTTPRYDGLFLEPAYADGQPYQRVEDDDEEW